VRHPANPLLGHLSG